MKTRIVILIFVFSGYILNASLSSQSIAYTVNNTVTTVNNNLTEQLDIRSALMQHIWHKSETVFLFKASGVAAYLSTEVGRATWHLDSTDNHTLLVITYENGVSELFELRTNEGNLIWLDAALGKNINVQSKPIQVNSKIEHTRQNLIGTWNSSVFSKDVLRKLSAQAQVAVISASFHYHFNADGTFVKNIVINKKEQERIEGLWDVTEDGMHLVMHFKNDNNEYQSYTAKIKYFSFDELVLDQAFITSDLENHLYDGIDSFFFNKQ